MQFDSQERPPIFYVILFGLLIFAIVFFGVNVKKAISAGNAKERDEIQQSVEEIERDVQQ